MQRYLSIVVVVVILIYFIFTSGLVYEVSGNEIAGYMDTPFSIAFSNERVGFVGVYNEDDIKCAKFLSETDDKPIWVDYMGMSLLIDYMGYEREVYVQPKDSHYLLLHTWNNVHNKMVYGWIEASRVYEPLPDLSEYNEVFRSGNAIVYKKS